MEFHFDFQKTTISKKIGEFLIENLPSDAAHIKRLMSGKKLEYKDANQVIIHILTALYSSFGEIVDTEEIVINSQTEVENGTSAGTKPGTSRQALAELKPDEVNAESPTKAVKFDATNVCRFYATNKCRFGFSYSSITISGCKVHSVKCYVLHNCTIHSFTLVLIHKSFHLRE